MLSISTDYAKDHGNPEPYLREIAETGFSRNQDKMGANPLLQV